jgi:hypothetical protein
MAVDAKEKVLDALGRAASSLRSKLSESRASLETFDVPFAQPTTRRLTPYTLLRRATERPKEDITKRPSLHSSEPSVSTLISLGLLRTLDQIFQSWRVHTG